MGENNIFIDFDGVILDSEERMLDRKYDMGYTDHKDREQYDKYFDYTLSHPEEWDYIIREGNSINNSVEILRELQELKKNLIILTKIHTLYEMQVKVEDLREHRKINIPIMFVPPGVKKHDIVIPNGQLLVDDSRKNVEKWKEHGGAGFQFDRFLAEDNDKKVHSLEFLLRG